MGNSNKGFLIAALSTIFGILLCIYRPGCNNGNKDTTKTDTTWIYSAQWPYGKWKGGIRDSMPHGNDTVIYLEAIEYPTTNFREQKIEKGYKVIGVYKDGDLIEGDIYDQNGKFIKKINTPTL